MSSVWQDLVFRESFGNHNPVGAGDADHLGQDLEGEASPGANPSNIPTQANKVAPGSPGGTFKNGFHADPG